MQLKNLKQDRVVIFKSKWHLRGSGAGVLENNQNGRTNILLHVWIGEDKEYTAKNSSNEIKTNTTWLSWFVFSFWFVFDRLVHNCKIDEKVVTERPDWSGRQLATQQENTDVYKKKHS